MSKTFGWVGLAVLVLTACGGSGSSSGASSGASSGSSSGAIATACNRSDRKASTPALCRCVQQVANQTLSGSDQSRAAKFFADPDKAHEAWTSASRADDAFWQRYKAFSAEAEASCS